MISNVATMSYDAESTLEIYIKPHPIFAKYKVTDFTDVLFNMIKRQMSFMINNKHKPKAAERHIGNTLLTFAAWSDESFKDRIILVGKILFRILTNKAKTTRIFNAKYTDGANIDMIAIAEVYYAMKYLYENYGCAEIRNQWNIINDPSISAYSEPIQHAKRYRNWYLYCKKGWTGIGEYDHKNCIGHYDGHHDFWVYNPDDPIQEKPAARIAPPPRPKRYNPDDEFLKSMGYFIEEKAHIPNKWQSNSSSFIMRKRHKTN
jgi:hypothetical protein